MKEIAQRMQHDNSIEESGKGFILERVRDDFVEARYFERLQTIERLIDPFGHESKVDRVQYLQIKFTAFAGPLGLEIVGTSKDVRKLTNSLERICDYKLTLSNISVDPIAWAIGVEKYSGIDFYTESIQITNMYISSEVTAKLVITGSIDVSRKTREVVGGRNHIIEKVKIHTRSKPQSNVILTNGAAATTAGFESSKLAHSVRESLLLLIRKLPL